MLVYVIRRGTNQIEKYNTTGMNARMDGYILDPNSRRIEFNPDEEVSLPPLIGVDTIYCNHTLVEATTLLSQQLSKDIGEVEQEIDAQHYELDYLYTVKSKLTALEKSV